MDMLAHGLWAGVGIAALGERVRLSRRTVAATIALAVLPDVPQMLPVLAWWLWAGGPFALVAAFATALPGHEPVLPPAVALVSHHLHCVAHSAIVAGAVTALVGWWRGAWWLPLLGWWSHIVIDVFTHSADYYASPVLYPFTQRGFDGIAWNTPWFMVANYLALAVAGVALWMRYRRRRR